MFNVHSLPILPELMKIVVIRTFVNIKQPENFYFVSNCIIELSNKSEILISHQSLKEIKIIITIKLYLS